MRFVILKAIIPGGASESLFATPVHIADYTTKDGVHVPAHTAMRRKKSAQAAPVSPEPVDLFATPHEPIKVDTNPTSSEQRQVLVVIPATSHEMAIVQPQKAAEATTRMQISQVREGTPTKVTVVCSNMQQADLAQEVFRRVGRDSAQRSADGLTLSQHYNRRTAETLCAALHLMQPAQPSPQATATAQSWQHREMHNADSPAPPAPKMVMRDGRVVRFTGFGRPFITHSEVVEPYFQGVPVRYAYYA